MSEPFAPATTLADLDSLSESDMIEGYASAQRGDPEPGPNRGRAFWHGWRCRMMDYGEIKIDAGHHKLVGDWLERQRGRRAGADLGSRSARQGRREPRTGREVVHGLPEGGKPSTLRPRHGQCEGEK
jgi:hypothetical protein